MADDYEMCLELCFATQSWVESEYRRHLSAQMELKDSVDEEWEPIFTPWGLSVRKLRTKLL